MMFYPYEKGGGILFSHGEEGGGHRKFRATFCAIA